MVNTFQIDDPVSLAIEAYGSPDWPQPVEIEFCHLKQQGNQCHEADMDRVVPRPALSELIASAHPQNEWAICRRGLNGCCGFTEQWVYGDQNAPGPERLADDPRAEGSAIHEAALPVYRYQSIVDEIERMKNRARSSTCLR